MIPNRALGDWENRIGGRCATIDTITSSQKKKKNKGTTLRRWGLIVNPSGNIPGAPRLQLLPPPRPLRHRHHPQPLKATDLPKKLPRAHKNRRGQQRTSYPKFVMCKSPNTRILTQHTGSGSSNSSIHPSSHAVQKPNTLRQDRSRA